MASREASAQQRSGKAPGRGSRRPTDVPTCPEEEESIGSRSEDVSAVDSIVTICENSKNEVGIVCLRMSDFVVDMSSYCDDKTYSKTFSMLTRHEPRQVIFPPAGKDSLLEKIVKNEFPLTRIEHVGRKYWCDVRGLQYVRHYAPHTEVAALETDVNSKYLCLAALAALIDFAASMEQTTFVKGTLRLKYSSAQGVMHLDPSTIRNLEILANARTGNPKGSLWGILSPNVKTCAGARLLRSSLIQPSNDLATIETRQDCTIELLEREEALADIQRILPGLAEVDRVLRAFMQKSSLSGLARAQASIASILHLKQVLRLAPTLAMALSSNGQVAPENNLLTTIQRNLQDEELAEMESAIDTVIEADAVYDKRASQRLLQSLFSIKHSVNNLLDVSRQTLGELTRDMEALTEHYEQALQINLSLNYNQRRGYHFMLPMAERELAERGGFIQLHAHGKKSVSCSTEELAQLNMRCQDMISQILMTTEQARLAADESGGKVLGELIEYIQWHLPVLFRLSESVALLDMLAGFAGFVSLSGLHYARPLVGVGAPLVLKQSRHPILERLFECNAPVPNDVFISSACNLQIVTGPNMAGKSTYLRQAALICLLAHTGCQVPAEQASVPLLGRIFTRISTADCLENNASTFVAEMRETSYILRSMSSPALVIADELGRGTSNRDGASLAWAVAEGLLKHPSTFTLFATHYLQLANLSEMYPNVKLLKLTVDPTPSRLRFLYRVTDGVSERASYQTSFLAELAGIPASVCELAANLSAEHEFDPLAASSRAARARRAYRMVAERLVSFHESHALCEEEVSHSLIELKSQLKLVLEKQSEQQASPDTGKPRSSPTALESGGVAAADPDAGGGPMEGIGPTMSRSAGSSPGTRPRRKGRRCIDFLRDQDRSPTLEAGDRREVEMPEAVEMVGVAPQGGPRQSIVGGRASEVNAEEEGSSHDANGNVTQEGDAGICSDSEQSGARERRATEKRATEKRVTEGDVLDEGSREREGRTEEEERAIRVITAGFSSCKSRKRPARP